MGFFRNREIRRFAFLISAICLIAILGGFLLGSLTGIYSVILCSVLCGVFFVFTKRRYKDIAVLCDQIDIVLHRKDAFDIDLCHEGELSILQSEIHKMIVRLREQSDLLKKEKVYLSNSIADVAHQLRTPLTSINMIVSFLGQPNLEPWRHSELIHDLKSLLTRLDWLITTLLKISKIDAGTAVFQKGSVSVKTLLEKAVEPFLIPLELRNIQLKITGNEAAQFIGDLQWTSEALGNIVKNCIEHSHDGGLVEIEYAENALFTEIVIRDKGDGIDQEDLPYIFERFYQGKTAKDASFGVGLALCRMILSFQNATIKASNNTASHAAGNTGNNAAGGACFRIKFYHQVV